MERSHRTPIPASLADAGRCRFVLKRPAIGAMMAGLFLVALAHSAFAACGDNPRDANAVAAARQAIDSQCDCSTVKARHQYVRCVAGVVKSDTLSEECKAQLLACAARSTCGRPSAVRCCRTDTNGATHCQTLRRAAACRAPRGGSVCVGTTSNGSCAGDPCGSLASTPTVVPVPAGVSVSTTTTTTTQAEIQCCVQSSPMGALDTCVLLTDTQCSAQQGLNAGPGSCSPNPCTQCCVRSSPGGAFDTCMLVNTATQCSAQQGLNAGPGSCSPNPCPTTTTPGATTTTTTVAAITTTTHVPTTTTTTVTLITTTTHAPTTTTSSSTTTAPPRTTTTLLPCGGVFPACRASCPGRMRCTAFGRTHSCVCR